MPRLSATRSIVSMFSVLFWKIIGILDGKSILMNAYPGRNRTKMMPRTWRMYIAGYDSPGTAKTAIVVAAARVRVIQYQTTVFVLMYCFRFVGWGVGLCVNFSLFSSSS